MLDRDTVLRVIHAEFDRHDFEIFTAYHNDKKPYAVLGCTMCKERMETSRLFSAHLEKHVLLAVEAILKIC